ncbi:MAG TPA: peroxiredoxin [Candidatus Binatia bacterium]
MTMISIGTKAPDFTLRGAYQGKLSEHSLHSYTGKWVVLFFYPADFTFICPTEVSGFSRAAQNFRTESADILGVSVDSAETHLKWAEELGGVAYPLLSDSEKTVSRQYGVLDEREGVALRATFIIRPTGEITYVVVSQNNVGRSVEETLRVLKALRTDRLCPAGWQPGEPTGDLTLKF